MSGWSGIVAQLLAQPGPSPGESGSDDHGGQAEHLGDLPRLQALPQVQLEDLLVASTEPPHRRHDVGSLHHVVAGVRHMSGELQAKPAAKGTAPPLPPSLVGQHPPGDAVEPGSGVRGGRHLRDSPPRDEERVGRDVGGVLRAIDPAQREAEHRVEVVGVEASKALRFTWSEMAHVCVMSAPG